MEHEFSVYRRYVTIANYPEPKHGKHYKINDIVECRNEDRVCGEDILCAPIFKQIKWWESRTFEELFSIRYIQVSEYNSYYIVGDILEVEGFEVNANCLKPYVVGFKVGSQIIKLDNCMPLEPFKDFKYRNKPRITMQKN